MLAVLTPSQLQLRVVHYHAQIDILVHAGLVVYLVYSRGLQGGYQLLCLGSVSFFFCCACTVISTMVQATSSLFTE